MAASRKKTNEALRHMKSARRKEMIRLYRFTRLMAVLVGVGLVGYGAWYFVSAYLSNPNSPELWFGVLPMYLGSMLLLVAAAMREDWFTNARRYW